MVNASDVPHERPTDISGFAEFFFLYPDRLLGGIWAELLIMLFFTVTFLSLSAFDMRRRFAAASFVSFVSAVLFAVIGIAGSTEITITAIALALSAVMAGGGDRGV